MPRAFAPAHPCLWVIDALEALNVPVLIGGSLASAIHGVARATLDADLVADLRLEHAEPLAQTLSPASYVDDESIRDAVRQRSSFNVIHMETMFKVDVFVRKQRPFDQAQFERRAAQIVASPEDVVLAKLERFRTGGEVCEQQWRDVLGVLKVQGAQLDLAYLRRWAAELEVRDLLDRALTAAGYG